MSSELGLRGQPSPTTDRVLDARLNQVQGTLPGADKIDRSIVIMATLVGALLLSRSVKNPETADRILEVVGTHLKHTQITPSNA